MFHIIGVLIIGFIIGLVARAVHPGTDKMGIILTTVLGIVGSIIAGYGLGVLGWHPGTIGSFIASVIGAIILIVVVGFIRAAMKGRGASTAG
ncbi:MAG TPA: GlsB/YeaQ/YmgE family stress response membrane protein [Nevskiaceae bacterium]|nr:GlsB/YeaQ/YmgE family stress response membrane protein [Nevskiaceae bacterium]